MNTVGGTAISAILGSKAPLASPTFTGPLTVTNGRISSQTPDDGEALRVTSGGGGILYTGSGGASYLYNDGQPLFFGAWGAQNLNFVINNQGRGRIAVIGEVSFANKVTAPSAILTGGGLTGSIDTSTVGGMAIPAILGSLGSLAPRANPTFTGEMGAGAVHLTEVGTGGAYLDLRQAGTDTSSGTLQWRWQWGAGRALWLAAFSGTGSYLGFPLYVTQPGKDPYGNSIDQPWAKLGTIYPIRAYNVVEPAVQMTGAGINDYTSVNTSSFAAGGNFYKYFSSAADNGFDVGASMLMDVAPTKK